MTDALRGGPTGYIVLRPAGIYGGARAATQSFLRDLSRRRFWIRVPPTVIVHPTYVDDVVQAIVRCVDRYDLAGEVFNVGGERAMALDDWAQLAANKLQIRLRLLTVPPGAVVAAAIGLSRVARALSLTPPNRMTRACHPVLSRALDTTKARERLGFNPMLLDHALTETISTARALGVL